MLTLELLSDRSKADKVYHKRIKEVYAQVCACAKWESMINSEKYMTQEVLIYCVLMYIYNSWLGLMIIAFCLYMVNNLTH